MSANWNKLWIMLKRIQINHHKSQMENRKAKKRKYSFWIFQLELVNYKLYYPIIPNHQKVKESNVHHCEPNMFAVYPSAELLPVNNLSKNRLWTIIKCDECSVLMYFLKIHILKWFEHFLQHSQSLQSKKTFSWKGTFTYCQIITPQANQNKIFHANNYSEQLPQGIEQQRLEFDQRLSLIWTQLE